ncbi:metabotropic glutamate receptor 3-like [Leptodactylus fuscus]|uniref:metabotropic glutamate receptor 3-like n=1 Tax=Leptodactylus fuscus TaxID=238119 RepID=UPI003F4F31DF
MASLFWTLLSLTALCSNGGVVSGQQSPKLTVEIVGYIYIDGTIHIKHQMVQVHLNSTESLELMEAMMFAIKEINNNSNFLQGIKLVLSPRIFTSNSEVRKGNRNKSKTIAAIIDTGEDYSFDEAQYSPNTTKIPVITCSTVPLKLPEGSSFLHTVPPVQYQSRVIIDILTHFGWTFVSTLASSDVALTSFMDEFTKEAKGRNICFATRIIMCRGDDSTKNIENLQSHPRAQVVVLFVSLTDLERLLSDAHKLNASYTWVVGNSLGFPKEALEKYNQSIGRIITVNILSYPLQKFNDYFQEKIKMDNFTYPKIMSRFHHSYFKKSTKNSDRKKEFSPSRKIMFVVNAVYAIAHALRDMYSDTFPNVNDDDLVKHRGKFLTFLRNTTFTAPFIPPGVNYTMKFDGNHNGPARYNICTIQENNGSFQYLQIGSWANQLILDTSLILWENNMVPESHCSKPCGIHEKKHIDQANTCCWYCIKCRETEIVTNELTCKECDPGYLPNTHYNDCSKLPLHYIQWGDGLAIGSVYFSSLGILSTIITGGVFIWNNNTPIVKASGREFCYILLSAVLLLFIMTFIFIARPSVVICSLRRVGLATSFTVCYSALLTKTIRITRIFTSAKKGIVQPRYINLVSQLSICLALITCHLVGLLIWLIVEPAEVTEYESLENKYSILRCRSEDMKILISLVYDALLILLCTVYAFKTRKYPENFNEAKCIGLTMYTTCIIWMAFLPVSYVTFNNPKVQITTLCVSVSLCAFVILGGLYVPKLYVIIFHPEKNVKSCQRCKGARLEKFSYLADEYILCQ